MQDILKRHSLLIFAIWTGVGEMARAVRIEPWSFHAGFVHLYPFPIDIRFQDTGFDIGAFVLGLVILGGGVALHVWRIMRRRSAS